VLFGIEHALDVGMHGEAGLGSTVSTAGPSRSAGDRARRRRSWGHAGAGPTGARRGGNKARYGVWRDQRAPLGMAGGAAGSRRLPDCQKSDGFGPPVGRVPSGSHPPQGAVRNFGCPPGSAPQHGGRHGPWSGLRGPMSPGSPGRGCGLTRRPWRPVAAACAGTELPCTAGSQQILERPAGDRSGCGPRGCLANSAGLASRTDGHRRSAMGRAPPPGAGVSTRNYLLKRDRTPATLRPAKVEIRSAMESADPLPSLLRTVFVTPRRFSCSAW
jgi:hypothetical protein